MSTTSLPERVGRRVPSTTRRRFEWQRLAFTVLAGSIAVAWVLPVIWTLSGSFKPHFELIGPEPQFLPRASTLNNWRDLFTTQGRSINIVVAFVNSVAVALVSTFLTLLTSSMAGFAFARLRFPGRGPLFVVVLATMMIPFEVILVPLFLQFHRLGLLNSYLALILPHATSVLGVFLLRQFILNIPPELEDAARVDGGSTWAIYRHVILPLTKPAMATLSIIAFLGSWNDFLWPLIVVSSADKQTLPLVLITFRSSYATSNYGTVLASVILAITPPLLVFFFAQRFVIQGISRSGLKG